VNFFMFISLSNLIICVLSTTNFLDFIFDEIRNITLMICNDINMQNALSLGINLSS